MLVEIICRYDLGSRYNCFPVHQHGTDYRLLRLHTVRKYPFDQGIIHVLSLLALYYLDCKLPGYFLVKLDRDLMYSKRLKRLRKNQLLLVDIQGKLARDR